MDKVQVIKQESSALGGDAAEDLPYSVPVDAQEDAAELAGIYLQDAQNRDSAVLLHRTGSNMLFKDATNTTSVSLSQLITGSREASYVVLTATSSLPNERVLTVSGSTGLRLTDAGAGGTLTLAINNNLVATTSGSVFIGPTYFTSTASFSMGMSGSVTSLSDGRSFIVAGSNVTVESSSNGQIVISSTGGVGGGAPTTSQYVTLATDATLTNERVLTPGIGLYATDAGAGSSITLTVDDDVVATLSGSIFSGRLESRGGITGSVLLTRTQAGLGGAYSNVPFIAATGKNLTIQSSSIATAYTASSYNPGTIKLSLSNVPMFDGLNVNYNPGGAVTTGTFKLQVPDGAIDPNSYAVQIIKSTGTGIHGGITMVGSFCASTGTKDTPSLSFTDFPTAGLFYDASRSGVGIALDGGQHMATVRSSGLTLFSGSVTSPGGFSGSLTRLSDGTAYLRAGPNVTVVSGTDGSVVISSSGVGGGGLPGGSDGEVQFNSGGTIFLATGSVKIDVTGSLVLTAPLILAAVASGSVASGVTSGTMYLYHALRAGRSVLRMDDNAGIETSFQPCLWGNSVKLWQPAATTTAGTSIGWAFTSAGTVSHPALAVSNVMSSSYRTRWTSATTANVAGGIYSDGVCFRGTNQSLGMGGFYFSARFGTPAANTGARAFIGLWDSTQSANLVQSTNPGTARVLIGMGYDSTDAVSSGWSIFVGSSTATTKTTLASTSRARHDLFDLTIFSPPSGDRVYVKVDNLSSGTLVHENVYTVNLPSGSSFLKVCAACGPVGTAAATQLDIVKLYLEVDI